MGPTWNNGGSNYWSGSDWQREYYLLMGLKPKTANKNTFTSLQVQPGDIIYFFKTDENEPYHAALITKVDESGIYYTQQTDPYLNQSLNDMFDSNPTYKVEVYDLKQ